MDLRYAFRILWKNPGFTAIAVAALALGIGANSAIFTVVNAVLLQPLPYPGAERIMRLGRQYPGETVYSISVPKYMAWRANDSFESLALYDLSSLGVTLTPGDQANALHVSSEYFKVFGVTPVLGRTFTTDEDRPGGAKVAVLSNGFWHSHFGGDPSAIGRAIKLGGDPHVIVGVLPAGFDPQPAADIWTPIQADPASSNLGNYLSVAGRLRPGVSVAAAAGRMNVLGERIRASNPKLMEPNESVVVTPLRDVEVRDVKTALFVLFGAVAMVLLIACANVANLLLARAAERQREIAIRAAIGADRWRVVRQLLTESVLLAGIGGVLGLVLGAWGVRALLMIAPGDIPRLTDSAGVHVVPPLDWRVALFTMAVTVVTGVLFGLLPALRTSRVTLSSTLKEAGSRSGTGLRHNRARAVLVVAEIAFALVLLTGATLLIRTFVGLHSVDPGIDPHNVITLQTSLSGGGYSSTAKVTNLIAQVTRRIEALPGVDSAGAVIALPIESGVDLPFEIAGRPTGKSGYTGEEQWRYVSPDYFRTMSIPLRRGRGFTETDAASTTPVVIVNEAMVRKYWPSGDALGQIVVIGKGLGPDFDDPPRQIVGIAGNVRESGLGSGDQGAMYIPQSQVSRGLTALANSALPLSWTIRTAGDPMTMRPAIEREIRAVDPGLPISKVRTMRQVIAQAIGRQEFNMRLLTIFAAIALLLAAIGIYGLIAYSVEQRTQEIGIRMALGAGRGDMLRMVLSQGLKLAGIGVVVGLGIAYGVTRVLESLLFGVKSSDPWTFGVVGAALVLVAMIATYIPALRATRIQPVDALRHD